MNSLAFVLGSLLSFIVCLLIGIFVFINNRNTVLNKWFIAFNFFIGIWSGGIFFINIIPNPNIGLIVHRICYAGGVLLVPAFVNLVYSLTGKKNTKGIKRILYITCLFLLICLATPLFIKTLITIKGTNLLQVSPGPVYYIYILYITVGVGYCLFLLLKAISVSSGLLKNQMKFIFIAYAIEYVGGGLYFSSIIGTLDILPPSDYMVILGGLILFYAIIKHRLMAIDLAWRYITEYTFYLIINIIFFMSCAMLLIKFNIDLKTTLLIVVIATVIINPYLKKYITNKVRNYLLRKYYKIWNRLKVIANDKNRALEIQDIVEIITIDVKKALNLQNSSYYILKENKDKYEKYLIGNEEEQPTSIGIQSELVFHLEKTREFIYKEYFSKELYKDLELFFEEDNIELYFPIFFNGILVGIVAYGKKYDENIYHKEELNLLSSIINNAEEQINHTMQLKYMSSSYAEQALKKYKNTYQMQLLRSAKHMGGIRDIKELKKYIVDLVNRSVDAEYTHLYFYDEQKKGYVHKAGTNTEMFGDLVQENDALMKYIRQRKEIIWCPDLDKWAEESKSFDLLEASKQAKKLKAKLLVPLIDITLLGFIVLGDKYQTKGSYTNDDLSVLSFIADRAELTMSNILIREKSEKDDLLELHNKGYMHRRIREEIANSLKDGDPVSFLMIDADDFKWFNDNHGHPDGDKILKTIVSAIQGIIRPTDEFCRYGGEELPIIAPGTNNQGAKVMADKIIKTMAIHPEIIKLSKKYGKKISVSIGIACFHPTNPIDEFTNEEIGKISVALIMRADKALKQAKKNGKNQAYESKPFQKGEEEKNKDFFRVNTLII